METLDSRRTPGERAAALEKSLANARKRDDTRQIALISNDLGVMYYLDGRSAEARNAIETARELFTSLNDVPGQARSIGNLARLDERAGNVKAAVAGYQLAADLLHQVNACEDESATLRRLSQLYLKKGGWLEALAAYDRALQVKPRKSWFDSFLRSIYQIPLRMMGMSG